MLAGRSTTACRCTKLSLGVVQDTCRRQKHMHTHGGHAVLGYCTLHIGLCSVGKHLGITLSWFIAHQTVLHTHGRARTDMACKVYGLNGPAGTTPVAETGAAPHPLAAASVCPKHLHC